VPKDNQGRPEINPLGGSSFLPKLLVGVVVALVVGFFCGCYGGYHS
jgi:hypothetical protein